MPIYEVQITRLPEKVIRKLPRDLSTRIDRAILALAAEPRPAGCKKLRGYDDLYHIRVGDWWITYAIIDNRLIVLALEVSPRCGAYRSLPR